MAPQRLLKLTLAHYRNPDSTEEECHRFLTEEYIPKVIEILQRHKLETYSYHFTPSPVQNVLRAASERLQNGWTVDDHDLTVEFYFREIAGLVTVSTDPDFIALKSIEGPFISQKGVVARLGWVETYVADEQAVNLIDGKSQYESFEQASAIQLAL
ncbi:hypothetical protein ANOM_008047 [Aspergillus nomiae NRRL 13137]|uniref:EthD domain-containing protein n=1 Tax=Aspergillus nomiae NRRL (strain ATCC 15546 / NRRL 13137 / CBS 260.88 / M93) TaxID=1509407 RepID=A0A0L1IYX3_ASPN3|nr:uncharacterized protein ANOM_008047 [Aspergillus nomiae NRRL 13137]KNG84702.1 hypothetical protein ANOM_008047 [Aspergillus nomiae NRRL 13137]